MIRKLILVLSSIIFFNCYTYSQEQLIGFKTGFINPNFLESDNLAQNSVLFLGLNYEFIPDMATFSISTEIQYIIDPKWFLMPVSINFSLGHKIKFLASGGILPIIRLGKVDPDKTLDIGGLCRIGISYNVNRTVSLYSKIGFLFIPHRTYYYSHFGETSINKNIGRVEVINFGLNYMINTKKH